MRRAVMVVTLAMVLFATGPCVGRAHMAAVGPKVRDVDLQRVILAIKDEIYARGYHTYYIDLDPRHVPVYVSPRIENNMIWVIYKLLPHGEVLRGAVVRPDGLAVLYRTPDDGFRPTQGAAMPTLYLDDADVIKMKTTWKKVDISIAVLPASEIIEDAKRREKARSRD